MEIKNLCGWWINGIVSKEGITDEEKNRLEQIGIDSNSSSHNTYCLSDLKKILQNESVLKKHSHPIAGQIHFIIFFSTWFCNDCMVIINGNSSYTMWICVYEPSYRNFGEWLTYHSVITESYLEVARDKARTLSKNIGENNPVLHINQPLTITYYEERRSPEMSLINRSELPTTYLSNPDQYIRLFDIVKVCAIIKEKPWLHSGIYLGKGKVMHAVPRLGYTDTSYDGYGYGDYYGGSSNDRTSIASWEKFRKFWRKEPDKVVRIRAIIPFKTHDEIMRHIAKVYHADSKYFGGKGDKGEFTLAGNNCERFANRCVLGLDLSEHGEILKEKKQKKKNRTHHKIDRIENHELEKKINETSSFLDGLNNSAWAGITSPSVNPNEWITFTNEYNIAKNYVSPTPDKIGENYSHTIEVKPELWI